MRPSREFTSAPTAADGTTAPTASCDPDSFVDLDTWDTENFDGVCGPCLVLADHMDDKDENDNVVDYVNEDNYDDDWEMSRTTWTTKPRTTRTTRTMCIVVSPIR